jgi:AraC-like DNA-binding protein
MACTLAESPCDPFHRKLRQLRCLRCRFDCYRVERTSSRAGVSPAEVQRLFTAHCYANNRIVGSEEARLRASLRPPPKLHVRFSRMQLSRRHVT